MRRRHARTGSSDASNSKSLIAQKDAQLVHHPRDRAIGIAIGAVEGGTGMGIDEPQSGPPGRHRRCPGTARWRT